MKKLTLLVSLFFAAAGWLAAQGKYFDEVVLATESREYKLSNKAAELRKKRALLFEYSKRNLVGELRFFPKEGVEIEEIAFAKSSGYEVLDSLVLIENQFYRGRMRFLDLSNNQPLSLLVKVATRGEDATASEMWELPLLPYTQTWVRLFAGSDMFYVGEESVFDLETNNIDNIKVTGAWNSGNGIDYRVALRDNHLYLHIIPKELGTRTLNVKLETLSPFLDSTGNLSNTIVLTQHLNIKASRIAFLNLDKKEITYDDEARAKGVIATIDNHKYLQINRTYRIEAQESAGGSLIAELYTMESLANDKVLCKLTVFNLHRKTEGYLYIKDRDVPMFITNFDITPKMQITGVFVLHEGEDWQKDTKVNPGERIDVSIEGEALHKARFSWQDADNIMTSDTVEQTENRRIFRLRIPMNINKRTINLLNNGQPTETYLTVEEYQRPKPFEFITLNYGEGARVKVSKINNVIIARKTVSDFTFVFDKADIDSKTKLYGKQYLDIDVRILGRKGEIVEVRSLKNQLVCPDETSPRGGFYKDKNNLKEDININALLSSQTHSLEYFGRVQVDLRHAADKYSESVFEKHIEVVYQPKVLFDIDLSFPAGMMIQNLGESESDREAKKNHAIEMDNYNKAHEEFQRAIAEEKYDPNTPFSLAMPSSPTKASFTDNLGGVSIALIAQLSFTDNEKAGKLRPYRAGAGFLFINTFNFNENAKRDLALVVVGSIYPLSSRSMFNVPIHVGFGYKLQDKIPFLMISPGISISF